MLWLGLDAGESELVAMHAYGFYLQPLEQEQSARSPSVDMTCAMERNLVGTWRGLRKIRLPDGLRNIALEPMRTTTACTFSSDGRFFACSLRTCIYVYDRHG